MYIILVCTLELGSCVPFYPNEFRYTEPWPCAKQAIEFMFEARMAGVDDVFWHCTTKREEPWT